MRWRGPVCCQMCNDPLLQLPIVAPCSRYRHGTEYLGWDLVPQRSKSDLERGGGRVGGTILWYRVRAFSGCEI